MAPNVRFTSMVSSNVSEHDFCDLSEYKLLCPVDLLKGTDQSDSCIPILLQIV